MLPALDDQSWDCAISLCIVIAVCMADATEIYSASAVSMEIRDWKQENHVTGPKDFLICISITDMELMSVMYDV